MNAVRREIMEKILQVKNVEKYYGSKSSLTKAINGISFEVNQPKMSIRCIRN